MYYVRNADDLILYEQSEDPHSDAVNVLQLIIEMLSDSIKLNLNVEKSKITNPRKDYAYGRLCLRSAAPSYIFFITLTLISISNHVYFSLGANHNKIISVSQLR